MREDADIITEPPLDGTPANRVDEDARPERATGRATTRVANNAESPKPVRAADGPHAEQPIAKQLALLAIPTFGQLIAEPAFILIDTAIVGHVGDAALAGLSLGSTVILTAVGLCMFLAYATTSQVAHLFGAGKRREGLQSGVDSLWLSLCIGVVLAAALFIFAEPICYALGGRGETLEQALAYTRAVVLGAPAVLMVYAANGIFRGLQKVRITLAAAISGALLNTVLDVLFVIVWGWGITGSGVATFIAQWFMGLFLVIPAITWALRGGASLKPRVEGIMAAGGDGMPLFLRTLAVRVAMVATVVAAAYMGTEVLAGYQVVNATWNFALNVLDSVAIAGQALVGAQLGARRYDRARELTRATARAGLVMGVGVGAAFVLAGLVAGQAFSPNPEVQAIAAAGMVVTGVALPLQGWMWALDGILIGAGDFRYLAGTCAIAAGAQVVALVTLVVGAGPAIESDMVKCALLWTVFNTVFMGVRAIANGTRARGDAWMHSAE